MIEVEFFGGPQDGTILAIPGDAAPNALCFYAAPDWDLVDGLSGDPGQPLPQVEYVYMRSDDLRGDHVAYHLHTPVD